MFYRRLKHAKNKLEANKKINNLDSMENFDR